MDNQIYFTRRGGEQRVPIESQVFKHGDKVYLSLENRRAGTHVALIANASALAGELRRLAGLVERAAAINDQGHISRAPAIEAPRRKPVVDDLNGDPAHDWPIFVERFANSPARSDILPMMVHLYKQQFGYKPPDVDAVLDASEQVSLDFYLVQPYLPDILDTAGSLKRGARARIAEALGIKDAGNYRAQIDAVLEFISNNDPVELLGNWAAKSNESNADPEPEIYQKYQIR